MANKFFGAISHIGGSDGDLDKISKDIISDGDAAYVIDAANNTIDFYTLDASNATAEDATNFTVIVPDDEAASPGKRWIKVAVASWDGSTAERGTVVTLASTQTLTNKTLTSPIINTILAKAGETGIAIAADGAVTLYYDDTAIVTTTATGITTDSITAKTADTNLTLAANGTGVIDINDSWNAAGQTCSDLGTVSTADIDGGSIDGATIGGATPAAGDFTTLDTNAANEFTFRQNANEGTLTDGASIAWNLAASQKQVVSVTLGGNRAMAAPTNHAAGATYILRVVQDGTGGRTLSWNAAFLWGPDGAPDLSPNADDVDVFAFYDDGTSLHGRRFYNEA